MAKLKINENQRTLINQFEIVQEEKKYYESLYKSQTPETRNISNSTFLEAENITPLNDEGKCLFEGLVSEKEWLSPLKDFKNSKSPGTDSLTVEFYKFFWSELGADSFNYAFTTRTTLLAKGVESYHLYNYSQEKQIKKST